jgi:hypothetical protein
MILIVIFKPFYWYCRLKSRLFTEYRSRLHVFDPPKIANVYSLKKSFWPENAKNFFLDLNVGLSSFYSKSIIQPSRANNYFF